MKITLLIVLALVAWTAAVPVNPQLPDSAAGKPKRVICAPQTPCAWVIYTPVTLQEQAKVENTYCSCDDGFKCNFAEDDQSNYSNVYKCQPSTNS